jgi:hypothetical protein
LKLFISCDRSLEVLSTKNIISTLEDVKGLHSVKSKKIIENCTEEGEFYNLINLKNNFKITEFEETSMIPTYSFAICAGPFSIIENTYKKYPNIPKIRVLHRRFIYKDSKIDYDIIFQLTEEILIWFQKNILPENSKFLGSPDDKIDLIFVPDLEIEAMENVGCITFDEGFINPHASPNEKLYFYYIIAHELTHTWFGNYITPEWWDDLWLNESFATFLAYLCLSQVLKTEKFSEHNSGYKLWLLFNKNKHKGIMHDQYSTRHKIRDELNNTSEALNIFDQITYYKGAAILKYWYYLGFEKFFTLMKNYINEFMFSVINYEKFKKFINEQTSAGMENNFSIVQNFIENTGVPKLKYEIKINTENRENYFSELIILQGDETSSKDRYYNLYVDVLLVYNNPNNLNQGKSEILVPKILIENKKQSIIPIDGNLNSIIDPSEIPDAIILNCEDWTYCKQTFDKKSINYLIENTKYISNPITRIVILRDFSEMVRDCTLTVQNFVDFCIHILSNEKELLIIEQVLKCSSHAMNNYSLVNDEKIKKLKNKLFNFIHDVLLNKDYVQVMKKTIINYLCELVDFGEYDQILLLSRYLRDENLDRLKIAEIISECPKLNQEQLEEIILAIEISQMGKLNSLSSNTSQDLRDNIFIKLCSLIQDENDKKIILLCQPNLNLKEKTWELFVNKKEKNDRGTELYLSDEELIALMKGFARKSQHYMLKDYFENKFFEDFPVVKSSFGEEYSVKFFKYLNPSFILKDEIVEKLKKLRKVINDGEYHLKRVLEKSMFNKFLLFYFILAI